MHRQLLYLLLSLICLSNHAQDWQLVTPLKSGRIVRDCSFLDPMNGIAVVQNPGTVMVTDDGGVSWDIASKDSACPFPCPNWPPVNTCSSWNSVMD